MTPEQQQNYETIKRTLGRILEHIEENKDKLCGIIAVVGIEGKGDGLDTATWTEGEIGALPWMFLEAGRSVATGINKGSRIKGSLQ